MLILAFETSAKAASVALMRDGVLLGESYQNTGLTHSQTLMVMAQDLMRQCGVTVQDLTHVAVAEGPGSFTGVRIGVAAAKGLSWGGELPCCGVSTLEAMALSLGAWQGYVCPVMDARRSQVYNALFYADNGHLERVKEDRAISLEELKAEDNRIIRIWRECGLKVDSAADSQALIQLKREYCDMKKCLHCRFGYEYLKKNNKLTS